MQMNEIKHFVKLLLMSAVWWYSVELTGLLEYKKGDVEQARKRTHASE